jgi:hypothetical protein
MLTVLSAVVTACTTYFKWQNSAFCPQFISVFRMDLVVENDGALKLLIGSSL